jgi:hypothetical protein
MGNGFGKLRQLSDAEFFDIQDCRAVTVEPEILAESQAESQICSW